MTKFNISYVAFVPLLWYDTGKEKGMNEMKGLRIAGRVLRYILVLVILILLLLHLGVTAMYADFFAHSEGKFIIPGLTSSFVPQGFEYIEETDTYLICGYMADDSASRVYVRDPDGNTYHSSLLYADGTPYVKHAGGICVNGDYVYLAGDDGVDVFLLSDILNGRDVVKRGKILTGHDMAYCSFYNGYLLAGNFYHPETYETPDHHRITTPAGDANTALITVFKADATAEFGIDPTPVAAISTREKVQGICFTSEEEIVLSTSYSVATSHLYFYSIDTDRTSTVEVLNGQVPLYYLDSVNLKKTVDMPPMSEELVFRDGRVWVMCESACNKYIFGKLIRGYQVFAYDITA